MSKIIKILIVLIIVGGVVWTIANTPKNDSTNSAATAQETGSQGNSGNTGGTGNSNGGKNMKIGVILPLSGDYADIGDEVRRGVDLAITEKDTVFYEDDKLDPKLAVDAANKLISTDKVDFVIVLSSDEATAVADIFNKNKIPLVAIWDSNDTIRNAGPYIYSNGFSNEKAGAAMADFAANTLKLTKIALINNNDSWSTTVSTAFKNQFEKNGGTIVFSKSYDDGGITDSTTLTSNLNGADGIYFPLIPSDALAFIKKWKALAKTSAKSSNSAVFAAPLMSADGVTPEVVATAGKDAENLYFSSPFSETDNLGDLYNAKYSTNPTGFTYVAAAFDTIKKIADSGMDFSKAFGSTRSADRVEGIFQVKDGEMNQI